MAIRNKKLKRKANSNNECYNHHKLKHFEKNYFLPDKRLNRATQESQKKELQK